MYDSTPARKSRLFPAAMLAVFSFALALPTFAACPTGESQVKFLHTSSGSESVQNGAVLDIYNVPAGELQMEDTLMIVGRKGGTSSGLLSVTNAVGSYGALTATVQGGGVMYIGAKVGQNPLSASASFGSQSGTAGANLNNNFNWTSGWALNLTDSTAGSAAVNNWSWTIYKINGTGTCASSSSSGSSTDTPLKDSVDRLTFVIAWCGIVAASAGACALGWKLWRG